MVPCPCPKHFKRQHVRSRRHHFERCMGRGEPEWVVPFHALGWDDWTVVSTPDVSSTYQLLFDVPLLRPMMCGLSDALGYLLPGAPLMLHWDGTIWTYSPAGPAAIPENYSTTLFGVEVVSHDDVWAVGNRVALTNTTHPLLMHYAGGHWNQLPTVEEFGELWSVTAISANDVWAVGYHYDQSQLRAITRTIHWDGQSWSIIPSPNLPSPYACFLTSVVARSSNDVMGGGEILQNQTLPLLSPLTPS